LEWKKIDYELQGSGCGVWKWLIKLMG
jgi:hypothetical protein